MGLVMKSQVQRIVRGLGYEIRRYAPTSSERAQLMAVMSYHEVDLVFDIGANTGGFGRYLRDLGYRGRMVSFEPMKAAYDELVCATANDRLWTAETRSAIGAENGEVKIHISGNSESSSILEMLDAHSTAAPESSYLGSETVPLRTLDSLGAKHISENTKLFLKIDTQGYEEQVLEGGKLSVSRASVLQIELSLVPLYLGQKLMPEMLLILSGLGFDLWGIAPVFADPTSGRMLQVDGIFCRSV